MNYIYGRLSIETRKFESKRDVLNCIAQDIVVLSIDNAVYPAWYYVIIVKDLFSGNHQWSISFTIEQYSLMPSICVLNEMSLIVIGHSSNVVFINTTNKSVLSCIELDSPYFYFYFHQPQQLFIIVYETGVIASDTKGKILWKYACDIIVDSNISDNNVTIIDFDNKTTTFDLVNGILQK
jgi:hypothetical protein